MGFELGKYLLKKAVRRTKTEYYAKCGITIRPYFGLNKYSSTELGETEYVGNSTTKVNKYASSVFGKSRRGPRARRVPLHPRRAPYGRHWRDFSEEVFVVGGRLRVPKGALRPEKPLEGLSGGTFRRWEGTRA